MVLAFVGNTVLLLPGVPSLLGLYLLFVINTVQQINHRVYSIIPQPVPEHSRQPVPQGNLIMHTGLEIMGYTIYIYQRTG